MAAALRAAWDKQFRVGGGEPVIGASEAQLKSLAMPACIVPGNDKTHPRAAAEKLAGLMPNAELHPLMGNDLDDDVDAPANWDAKEAGLATILHGIQFNLLGLFFLGLGIFTDFTAWRQVFLQFVRRPGLPLMVIGVLCLMQAIIALSGSLEDRQGARWLVIMNLVVSRLLPGIILVMSGLGAAGLGILEFIAPNVFDEMGGGFLETLYGLR